MDLKKIIKDNVKTDWKNILLKLDTKDIDNFLTKELNTFNDILDIYPPQDKIFYAFNHFNFNKLKVVIVGMDPYIQPGEAMGLAFSVPKNSPIPPSLKNIYKEIESDIGINTSQRNGDLTTWAKQGVLLLNTALTVREGKSGSHAKKWENYTDNIIKYISENNNNIIFILWGNHAKSKKKLIDKDKHFIIESVHPSPLSASRGFFGGKYFSKTNEILKSLGKKPIEW